MLVLKRALEERDTISIMQYKSSYKRAIKIAPTHALTTEDIRPDPLSPTRPWLQLCMRMRIGIKGKEFAGCIPIKRNKPYHARIVPTR